MRITKITLLLLALALVAFPSTVQFVNSGSGANNGSFYVGPYNLLVDGQPFEAVCITWDLDVAPPYIWTAQIVEPNAFEDPFFTKLLEAEWLREQFSGHSDWVGIHQAIWGIFGGSYTDASTLTWEAAAQNPVNYGSVDPHGFSVLVPDQANYTQTFLFDPPAATAEPGTIALLPSALGMILLAKARRKRA